MKTQLKEEAQSTSVPEICSVCHQPILPTYYFCPNCGIALTSAPLSTTIWTQFGIYLFSIILPFMCFLFITKWPARKYLKSNDPKARIIGRIAWLLIIASTLFTFWYAYYITKKIMNSISSSISTDLGGFGY